MGDANEQLYDTIGITYTLTRRTDPRIAAQLWTALGDAQTVLNVGAGAGSYEPSDRDVLAVEPSAVMRAQRPPNAAPCIPGTAEHLPFDDQSEFEINLRAPEGTSLESTEVITNRIATALPHVHVEIRPEYMRLAQSCAIAEIGFRRGLERAAADDRSGKWSGCYEVARKVAVTREQ